MVIANKDFIQACMDGQAVPSEISDYVAYWHEHYRGDKSLGEFLGLTADEQAAWAKSDDSIINKILQCRRQDISITETRDKTAAEFKPIPVTLTERGREIVNVSANFREAEQIYMIGPVSDFGNVLVATDEKGTVNCYVPEEVIIR